MRITNSMMTANTKANMNINKANEDRLNTMTASGQKIIRPSDDPVVAIRAMRLNTSLTELEQYSGKNIPDASAWFTDTETALSQTDDLLSDIREKLNQASSQENVTSNVKDILEELKQLKTQFYALGNADSAGRTVFTGYRTGEMLTFTDNDTIDYSIVEKFKFEDIQNIDYVKGTHAVTKDATDATYIEENIQNTEVARIRLSYDKLNVPVDPADMQPGEPPIPTLTIDGTPATMTVKSTTGLSQADIDDIYTNVPDGEAYFIPETGEVILGKDLVETIRNSENVVIQYDKKDWQKGDLRPEHYFECITPKEVTPNQTDKRTYSATYPSGIEYNLNRIDAAGNPTTEDTGIVTGFKEQNLTYEIAYNQSININIHASDAYSHDIGRDIDELVNVTQLVADSEIKIANIKGSLEKAADADKPTYEKMLAAAQKENDLLKEKMHKMYTAAITAFKGYSDGINQQIAQVGALTSRLDMTKNRVKDQKSNVKILADDNINADIAETALDFKNAQLALEAARLAAGKIANQTLLNYI